MNDLDKKYRNDTLTAYELAELRKQINAATDEQLERQMLEVWNDSCTDISGVSSVRTDRMKRQIDYTLKADTKRTLPWWRLIRLAATLLLPVFLVWNFFLYRENNELHRHTLTISTAEGEHAVVLLPDGSKVTLNALSELSYNAGDYNRGERRLRFNGEAYFEVRKVPQAPFIINHHNLRVEVLGTTFNFLARCGEQTAELSLEEGRVRLVSLRRDESVVLAPNEKALVDQATGKIIVVNPQDITVASAWTRCELVFRNAKLLDILHAIEKNYNIIFKTDCDSYLENTFTGTLPTHNLNEVLEIIELSYGLKTSIRGKDVLLEKK